MRLKVTILGCGSSGGVPRLGQGWGACDPENPKNRRLRCSILVQQIADHGGMTTVLVDCSPDLREQLLRVRAEVLDGIVLTHSHADHTHGIDDVRPLVIHMRRRIPIYMDTGTSSVVRRSFSYIFETPAGSMYPPLLDERRIDENEAIIIDGAGGPLTLIPFEVDHGEIPALGLRVGTIAYVPDVKTIPATAIPYVSGLSTWILDALRHTPHPSHFSVSDSLEWIERMQPTAAILTNLHTDLDYEALSSELPDHIRPAFDGLQIEI